MISTIINFCLTIIISIVLGKALSFLPYAIAYVPMRLYAGGYHAKNHYKCILFSTILFGITVIEAICLYEQRRIICLIIMIFSFIVLRIIAPIESVNKPLKKSQVINAKKMLLIFEVILGIIYIVMNAINKFIFYYSVCYYAELSVCFTVLLGKVNQLKKWDNMHKWYECITMWYY